MATKATGLIKTIKGLKTPQGVDLPWDMTVGTLREVLSALPANAKVMLMNENSGELLNAPHDVFVYNLTTKPTKGDETKPSRRRVLRSIAGAPNTVVFGFWHEGGMELEEQE